MSGAQTYVLPATLAPHPLKVIASYLGVTPPISLTESDEKEKAVTVTLMEELRRQGQFESEEESKTR